MTRLPIRLRLSLVFALTMAVVLAAVGVFLYANLRSALTEQIEDSLEVRLDELAALVQRDAVAGDLPGDEDRFAQVRDRNGTVVAASPGFESGPPENSRVLTREVGNLTVAAGASLEDRDGALATLLALLLVGGPAALVLATLAGYRLAGAALRPVESMRREAAEISSATSGRRLPVPAPRDEVRRLGETLNESSSGSTRASCASAASSPMRATSCARRSPCSAPSSSLRCDGGGRPRSWSARSARRRKRWSG